MHPIAALLVCSPILIASYYSGGSVKSSKNVERSNGDTGSEADWISKNNWVYLEQPVITIRALPGDGDQISLDRPVGPIQQAMSEQDNPVKALTILAKHESEKDRAVVSLWHEFFKPSREIVTRSVDQPITSVHILKPGTAVDKAVNTGNRFWDQPVPRSTGIDRYYKRTTTVPWYMVP
jgi:hypothetical protein